MACSRTAIQCASRTMSVLTMSTTRKGNALVNSTHPSMAVRHLSTTEKSRAGFFGGLRDRFEESQKKTQEKQFFEQIQKMSQSDKWTLQDYANELKKSLSGWRAMIPGVNSLPQVKQAKEAQKVVNAFVEEMGKDSTIADVRNLGRTEKLRISLKTGIPIEDLNVATRQLEAMDIMHRVVRRRHLEGKPLPENEQAMKTAIQHEGSKIITKDEKKGMRDSHMKRMKGVKRRR